MTKHIRNFSIVAHIDHGKSTLADRMIEVTQTVEKRKMQEQILDTMELERERGITIKMQPVRMTYKQQEETYTLNLIDTPGHIDFSYEVSRALAAVEGVVLLVDATQGIQAQTITTLEMAQAQGLTIIPVLNKIDLASARPDEIAEEIAALLKCDKDTILHVSAKEGTGVEELISTIIDTVPPPQEQNEKKTKALIFDFSYSDHRGVIVYTRVFGGALKKGDKVLLCGAEEEFIVQEVGVFTPAFLPKESLLEGEIGYVVTGIKEPGLTYVGDTLTHKINPSGAIPGFSQPPSVVWSSLYPESQDDFDQLRQSLERLHLYDASITFEEESSPSLGRGFRCGFLGMLHLEIVTERLKREFSLNLLITSPTIRYEVTYCDGEVETIYTPSKFPDEGTYEKVREPWVLVTIFAPVASMGAILASVHDHEGDLISTENKGEDRVSLHVHMPLRELMRNFFDEIKSASSGYASLSYEMGDMKDAKVVRMDILVAEDPVTALSRVVSSVKVEREARSVVEVLKDLLPRQQFAMKVQARALGRIIASKTVPALRKDVTAKLYGGDVTRKRKLLEKQKKGKKKLKERGRVSIPHEVFLKIMRKS